MVTITKKFIDEITENELEVFITENGRIRVDAGQVNDTGYYSGFVTLSKEDALELIEELTVLIGML